MFEKKDNILQAYQSSSIANPYAYDVFKDSTSNHDFFLLVRDKHYQEAYQLGLNILKHNPKHNAVLRFCHFIENNLSQRNTMLKIVKQMVYEEQEYETDSEAEEDDDSEDEDEESDKQSKSVSTLSKSSLSSNLSSNLSKNSHNSNTSKNQERKKSINRGCINKVHHWNHKCNNQKCPNKNK